MGKRFAIVIGTAALGVAVIAAGASANFRSVDDPRGDVKCSHRPCSDSAKRNADIVRATAGHHEGRRLKHTIRVVGKLQRGRLEINTDSGSGCDYVLVARRGRGSSKVRQCDASDPGPVRTGPARMDFHRHSVEIFFRKRSIGNPRHYGWRAESAGRAIDRVPNGGCCGGRYIPHGFGPAALGAAALGVMALGAQTAAAEVVKYDTELTLTKEWRPRGLYHGWVMSDRDRKPEYDPAKGVRKCMVGRRVVLFKLRPGPDRRLGTDRSEWGPPGGLFEGRDAAAQWPQGLRQGRWSERAGRDYGDRVRAVVKRKVRDRYVCRAGRAVYS